MWGIDRIVDEAANLSSSEQKELISRLCDQLPDDTNDALSPAWRAEIAERLAEYELGGIRTIPWEVVSIEAEKRRESRN